MGQWGLIPWFAKEPKLKYPTNNARSVDDQLGDQVVVLDDLDLLVAHVLGDRVGAEVRPLREPVESLALVLSGLNDPAQVGSVAVVPRSPVKRGCFLALKMPVCRTSMLQAKLGLQCSRVGPS